MGGARDSASPFPIHSYLTVLPPSRIANCLGDWDFSSVRHLLQAFVRFSNRVAFQFMLLYRGFLPFSIKSSHYNIAISAVTFLSWGGGLSSTDEPFFLLFYVINLISLFVLQIAVFNLV